jgi:putative flippase GtrA
LPVAIEMALVSNFVWNETLTFRRGAALRPAGTLESGEARPAAFRAFVRYQRACLAGAALNALATLSALAHGAGLIAAASIGVLAGGVWNLIFNVPRIWQAWAGMPAAPAEPAEHGRLQSSAAGPTASRKVTL